VRCKKGDPVSNRLFLGHILLNGRDNGSCTAGAGDSGGAGTGVVGAETFFGAAFFAFFLATFFTAFFTTFFLAAFFTAFFAFFTAFFAFLAAFFVFFAIAQMNFNGYVLRVEFCFGRKAKQRLSSGTELIQK
jgi:hypothetical protein